MADISSINLNNTLYNIKDNTARLNIESISTNYIKKSEASEIFATTTHEHNYLPLSGGTLTGNIKVLKTQNGAFYIQSTDIIIGNSSLTTDVQTGIYGILDKNGNNLTYLQGQYTSTNIALTRLVARNKNNSGSVLINELRLEMGPNNTRTVYVTDSASWRKALGLGTDGVFPITVAQGGTGTTTAREAANAFINALSPASATPPVNLRENVHIITESWSGTTGSNTYVRRPISVIYSGLTTSDITTALGYTPLQSVTKNAVTTALGYTPLQSVTKNAVTTALGFTPLENTKNAITTTLGYTPLQSITKNAVTTALGFTPLQSVTKNAVTTALGYTPLENTKNAITTTLGYIPLQSVTKNAVTTALGYTPLQNTANAITTTLGYIPVNKAGDTMTGNLRFTVPGSDRTATSITSAANRRIYFYDDKNAYLGRISMEQATTGISQLLLTAYHTNTEGTEVAHTLGIRVDKNGNRNIYMNSAVPWRDALNIYSKAEVDTALDNYLPLSGGSITGNLGIKHASLVSGTAPSSDTNTGTIYYYDKNSNALGFIRVTYYTNGNSGLVLQNQHLVNGTAKNNYLIIGNQADGTEYITLKSATPWLKALGLGTNGALPITIAQGGTGQTTARDAANAFINALATGTAGTRPARDSYIINQHSTVSNATYFRRTVSDFFKSLTTSDITTALGYTPLQSVTKNAVTTALGYTPLQSVTKNAVTTALGYTPLQSVTKNAVTTALGYTPLQSVTKNAVTTALQYTPLENTAKAITTTLDYTPVNRAGDTISGNLTMSKVSPYLYLKNTSMDNTTTSQGSTRYGAVYFSDKNDKNVAWAQATQNTAGLCRLTLGARHSVNDSNVDNTIQLNVSAAGVRTVELTDPSIWRTELSVYSKSEIDSKFSDSGWIVAKPLQTSSVDRYSGSIFYRKIWKTVEIVANNIQLTSSLSQGTNVNLTTIASGYFPSYTTLGVGGFVSTSTGKSFSLFTISINTSGTINITATPNAITNAQYITFHLIYTIA